LFGIANQLLATIALAVMTTILLKLHRLRYAWVTLVPATALVAVTMTASFQKMFHANPRIGFWAHAQDLSAQLASGALPAAQVADTQRFIVNDYINFGVTGLLAGLVLIVVASTGLEWLKLLRGRRAPDLQETPYVATQYAEAD